MRHVLRHNGFTLVEAILAIAILSLVAGATYEAFVAALRVVERSNITLIANALANEQIEIVRNIPYANVGVVGSVPLGPIPHVQTFVRDNKTFEVTTTIRNIDDPFDGTIGGSPNDTSPADYKLVALDLACTSCASAPTFRYQTWVAPTALEGASTNGALFVRVFDASGQPVVGADVHIENNQATPHLTIDDTTNNQGMYQLVDTVPGAQAYEITVSKDGYSSERTYAGGPWIAVNPHANVVTGVVTQISFAIAPLSTLDVRSSDTMCASIGNVDFTLHGSKLIGTTPDVLKYSTALTTDAAGRKTLNAMEWDTYTLTLTDPGYDLVGTIPPLPLVLDPDTTQDLRLIVAPPNPDRLLVSVRDAGTGLPLSDADVRLELASYDTTLTTGIGFLSQTDWSGPSGQATSTDNPSGYFTRSNVNLTNPAGDIVLANPLGQYETDGYLISSTFDTGTASNFGDIIWSPQVQLPETGTDSVKFQIATNNDGVTWNFLGPDGTGASYYTLTDRSIAAAHDGDRYLRYKVFLSTADTAYSPHVSDIQFTYTSGCIPPGQVVFSGLNAGTYNLTVSHAGYQSVTQPVTVGSAWKAVDISLNP
jgi:prepilin-type N-terminal cleavage/methylation domain-containing protein